MTISSTGMYAQIYQGQWLTGGSGSYQYSQARLYATNMKSSTITFSPAAGYFFLNRLAAGLRVDAGYQKLRYNTDPIQATIFYSIGPFARYYFLSPGQKVNLFADVGYGFAFGRYKNFTSADYRYQYNTTSIKAGPAVFLNQNTALEVTLGYQYSTRGPIDTAITNSIQLGIGLQIHLGRKKE